METAAYQRPTSGPRSTSPSEAGGVGNVAKLSAYRAIATMIPATPSHRPNRRSAIIAQPKRIVPATRKTSHATSRPNSTLEGLVHFRRQPRLDVVDGKLDEDHRGHEACRDDVRDGRHLSGERRPIRGQEEVERDAGSGDQGAEEACRNGFSDVAHRYRRGEHVRDVGEQAGGSRDERNACGRDLPARRLRRAAHLRGGSRGVQPSPARRLSEHPRPPEPAQQGHVSSVLRRVFVLAVEHHPQHRGQHQRHLPAEDAALRERTERIETSSGRTGRFIATAISPPRSQLCPR